MKTKGTRAFPLLLAALLLFFGVPMTAWAAGEVCQIGATQYTSLGDALGTVQDGETIQLLAAIDYDSTIGVSDKTITIDLNGFDLNVVSAASSGLVVQNGGVLLTDTAGGGEFNVTGLGMGICANTDGVAEVTSAEAISDQSNNGIGVYAKADANVIVTNDVTSDYKGISAHGANCKVNIGGSAITTGPIGAEADGGAEVVVEGDVVATADGSIGATAGSSGSITVGGNAQGVWAGVYSVGTGSVTVENDAVATGNGSAGARAEVGGSITVGGNAQGTGCGVFATDIGSSVIVGGNAVGANDGIIAYQGASVSVSGDVTAPGTGAEANGVGAEITVDGEIQSLGVYIKVGAETRTILQVDLPTTKLGYNTYTDGNAVIWVKEPSVPSIPSVCEIVGGSEYPTLGDALAAVLDGETIRLLDDIDYDQGIVVQDTTITIDLNGFDLNVVYAYGAGLLVKNGGVHMTDTDGGGEFNVTGLGMGIYALPDGVAEVTSAEATKDPNDNGFGVYAMKGASVIVTNNVTSDYQGISAHGANCKVNVGGSVITTGPMGAEADGGAEVVVEGDVVATNGSGVLAVGIISYLKVYGSVTAGGAGSEGASAQSAGGVNVTGNVQGESAGVSCEGADSVITVGGDVTATGTDGIGVLAQEGGTVNVTGGAEGGAYGVACYAPWNITTVVTVGGGVTATGALSTGARAEGVGAEITVDGEIHSPGVYIEVGGETRTIGQVDLPTSKPGYNTYTSGKAIIWVKAPTAPSVCEIVSGSEYPTLGGALAAAVDGDTIRLLDDIGHTDTINISGKTITFDLSGYDLNVVVPSGPGLSVSGGGVNLNDTNGGNFNITGSDFGVYTGVGGGIITVTSATATSASEGRGVYAISGSAITVRGDVQGGDYGIWAEGGSSVAVGGDVKAIGSSGFGVLAKSFASVTVEGDVQGGDHGIWTGDNSSVAVGGDVSGYMAVYAENDSNVEVDGSVDAQTYGAVAANSGSEVYIHGNVTSAQIGARAYAYNIDSGIVVVKIDGTITAANYIQVGDEFKDGSEASRTLPTLLPGYHTYSSGNNIVYIVYVKAPPEGPIVTTGTVTGITASGAVLYGNVTADGGSAVTERGFVYGASANPTISDSKLMADLGAGTGAFSATLTGLTASTTYHVRAYATNSVETAYGEDRTFTTQSGGGGGGGGGGGLEDYPPSVLTNTVADITAFDATFSGNATSDGGAKVTERGFVYGLSANPAIGGAGVTQAVSGSGTGAFAEAISGLTAGTTYHIRAYATNRKGTSYGADITFTTLTGGGGGYNPVSFKDVTPGAWYYDAVTSLAARGIITGTGNGNFSPDAYLTRGQFIVMLMRTYGIAPDPNPTDNFSDAGNTYYTGYLAAAKRSGIAAGIGNNIFMPENTITRQEMFTLLHNALKSIGQLPTGSSGKVLADFSDTGSVASWATEAMTFFVETGTIAGSDGKLNPLGITTRAEIAQVLYNLLTQ